MNVISERAGDQPVKYFGHFLGPDDQLVDNSWAEIAAIVYAPTFHSVLEIWCARIHAPDYLEADTFVVDDSADRVLRRAAHFVTGLDLGLMEISGQMKAANEKAI
ncbi:MAG: hypothetical protein VB913_04640 [Rhodospirillales bacterium]|jgi:hypothetical protein